MTTFLQAVWGGLVTGSAYAILALGFTLVFGVLRVLQFSHPNIFAAGAFVGFAVAVHVTSNLLLILLVSMAGMAVAGLLVERIVLRPLRDEYFLTPAIATIAAGIVIQNLIIAISGPEPVFFPAVISPHTYSLAGVDITLTQIVVLAAALAMMVALKWTIDRTRAGRAVRAVAEKPDVAQILGINTRVVAAGTMAVASALAGAAGVLIATLYGTVSPTIDTTFGFKGLVIMVVAGLGSITGAMFVGVALGVIETLASQYISSSYRDVFPFAILIIVLILRPAGLFGRLEPQKV
jgi:branched-chain amino acid transport system permease protein